MNPLAARLSCPCVQGYAQRDYDALAARLEQLLGRPVRLGHASRLPSRLPDKPAVVWSRPLVRSGLGGIAATRAHVVIGDRNDADEHDVFRCFDAATGDVLWEIG